MPTDIGCSSLDLSLSVCSVFPVQPIHPPGEGVCEQHFFFFPLPASLCYPKPLGRCVYVN